MGDPLYIRLGFNKKRIFHAVILPYAYSLHATEFCSIGTLIPGENTTVLSADRRRFAKSWHDKVAATSIWENNSCMYCGIRVGGRILFGDIISQSSVASQ